MTMEAERKQGVGTAMSVESNPKTNESIGELVAELTSQTARLVRDELRLAQKEFHESAKHAGIGAGLFSVAGLLAVLGLASLIAAGIAALSLVLPVWTSALIVAAVLFVAAGIAGLLSKKEVEQASPTPEQTVASVKEDIHELKEARHDRS
ncbi:MAG: Integral rane protein [Mycobacterium sp.]|jgi:Flp pilus assembly protein TadB|nr:Integral rane protein [Mycobacterium sp.]